MLVVPWQGRETPLQMGLRACSTDDWLDRGDLFGRADDFHAQIAEKNRLLDTQLSAVYAALPGSEQACLETCQLVAEALARSSWQALSKPADRSPVPSKQTGSDAGGLSSTQKDMPMLVNLSRQIAEDLLLLAPVDTQSEQREWSLQAALLAFPSHWQLADKIGRPMAEIHVPVPEYQARLDKPVNRFLSAIQTGTVSVRHNWTLQIDNHLHTPSRNAAPLANITDVPTRLCVRVERQTFRKLPDTGWIIFAIRSYIAPLMCWSDQPAALQELTRILQNFSPAMRQYRGVEHYEYWLRKWVDSRSC